MGPFTNEAASEINAGCSFADLTGYDENGLQTFECFRKMRVYKTSNIVARVEYMVSNGTWGLIGFYGFNANIQ